MNRYVLVICIFICLFLDETFYIDTKGEQRFNNTVDLSELTNTVWKSPPSTALSRRSIFNPSLIFDPHLDCWHMFCRYTRGRRLLQCLLQYLLEDDIVYIDKRSYRASILYIRLNSDFQPIQEIPVYVETEPYPGAIPHDQLFWQGEDPRVFRDENNNLKIQATIHQSDGIIRLGQGSLKTVDDKLIWKIERVIRSETSEKNWSAIPLVKDDSQLFLTHVSPVWRMATLSPGGVVTPVLETSKYDIWFNKLRCTSSCQMFTEKTMLTCLHTVHPYRTVLCEISCETLLPIRLSHPLEFKNSNAYIEFASGFCIKDDKVYFGMGFNDTYSEVISLTKERVEGLLVNVLNIR